MSPSPNRKRVIQSVPFILALFTGFLFQQVNFVAVIAGVGSSALLIMPTHLFLKWVERISPGHFNGAFYLMIGMRLMLAAAVLVLVLEWTKISEFFFTVSFIISYLYQSVTETIFTEKYLVRSTNRKK